MTTYSQLVVAAISEAGSLPPKVRARLATEMADPATEVGASLSDMIVASKSVAYFSAFGMADAALPASGSINSGHPYLNTQVGAGSGFAISGEALICEDALGYLNLGPLDGPVRSGSVEFLWTDTSGTDDELVVLIVSDALFAENPPTYANAAAHIIIERDRWLVQTRSAAGVSTDVASFTFSAPLAYGVRHRLSFAWDGYQVTITSPDGSIKKVPYNADTETWWGEYATLEIVDQGVNNKVSVFDVKFDTVPALPISDLYRSRRAQGSSIKSPGTQNVTLAPGYTTVITKSIVIPASLSVAVTASLSVTCLTDGYLSGSMSVGGNPTSVTSTTLLEAQAHDGMVTWTAVLDLSPFTAGSTSTLWVRLAHTGTGTYRTFNSGPLRVPTVIVHEADGVFA